MSALCITMEAGEPTTAWGRRSYPCVISPGHPCQCSGMAGSAPVVWILMVFRSWEISTPGVFRKCGMDRFCPGLETTLESSTTVSIRSVSPAIGYAGVRMAPDRSYQFEIEVIEESGEVTSPHPARFGRARKRARPSARRRRRLPSTCWAPAAAPFLNSSKAARGFGGQMSPHPPSFSASFGTHLNATWYKRDVGRGNGCVIRQPPQSAG